MSEAHTTEWKLQDLATAAGVSPRTVRYYVQRGLLPSPAFRGPDTAYGPQHLLRLRAIRVLQQAHLPLDVIQRLLDEADEAALEAMASGAVPGPVGSGAPPPAGPGPGPGHAAAIGEVGSGDALGGDSRWRRWALAPGVELHVAEDAGDGARALAERIRAMAQAGG